MRKHQIFIEDGANLAQAIASIFRQLSPARLAGRRVLVKPNMLRAARAEECVVTDPRLVAGTVAFLNGAGAQVMVGDNPMPDFRGTSARAVAACCGFVDAAAGAYRNIGQFPKRLSRPECRLKEFYVSREVLDCDLLVSLPKFKVHQLTTMSVAVKNHFGIIPGGYKPAIHAQFPRIDDFSQVLVEIYETRPPDLVIVDCLEIIDARGKHHHPGMIIAGDNGHAVDYACALAAGIDPRRVPTVKKALDLGLFAPGMIEYHGALRRIRGFHLPVIFPFRSAIVDLVARILYRIWTGRVPVIDAAACQGCGSCENVCPTRAIRKQQIDHGQCINCYCCLEVCPAGAVRIWRRIV